MDEGNQQSEIPAVARPWITLFDRYGFPLLIAVVFGLMIWKSAAWASPRAEKLFDEHIVTVKVLRENVVELRKGQEQQSAILARMDEREERTGTMVREIHEHVVRPIVGPAK